MSSDAQTSRILVFRPACHTLRESVGADAGNVDSVSPVENRDLRTMKKTDSRITESDLL